MTNEQAITKLQQYLDSNLIEDLTGNEGVDEAIRMGVDALKQSKIIYCKDCKYWDGKLQGGFYYFEHCSLHNIGTIQDDYCSLAERRTNG